MLRIAGGSAPAPPLGNPLRVPQTPPANDATPSELFVAHASPTSISSVKVATQHTTLKQPVLVLRNNSTQAASACLAQRRHERLAQKRYPRPFQGVRGGEAPPAGSARGRAASQVRTSKTASGVWGAEPADGNMLHHLMWGLRERFRLETDDCPSRLGYP